MRHTNKTVIRVCVFVTAVVGLATVLRCGRPTGVPESSAGDKQRLPFDREPRASGTSPSESVIPSTGVLSEGTLLLVRLQKSLSSVSARAGESFQGTLDEPVVTDGQTVIAKDARVTGRVLDARRAGGANAPGYLRITLVSVETGGRTIPIDTSSIFVKGGHEDRPSATGAVPPGSNDIVIPPGRRLSFRLAQAPASQ